MQFDHFLNGDVYSIQPISSEMFDSAIVESEHVLQRKRRLRIGRRRSSGRVEVAKQMLVHERRAKGARLDQAENSLYAAA